MNRGKQRAQIQAESVRILVVRAAGLADKVKRVTADLRHRALAPQLEPVIAGDLQRQLGLARVVNAIAIVKQPDERADGR